MAANWQTVTKQDRDGFPLTVCKWCGCDVQWQYAKSGNKYLAQPCPIYGEDGRRIKTIYPAHDCHVSDERRAEILQQEQQHNAAALEAGQIVKGQRVQVVKGRKYPIGTTGTVTWVADHEDAYGVTKARVAVDGAEAIFVNIQNLQALTTTNH